MTPEQAGWAFITVLFYLLAEAFYWMTVVSELGTRRVEMHVHQVLRSRTPDGSTTVDRRQPPALSARVRVEFPAAKVTTPPAPYLAGARLPHCAAPARYPHTSVDVAVPRPVMSTGLDSPPSPQTPAGAGTATPSATPASAGPNPRWVA